MLLHACGTADRPKHTQAHGETGTPLRMLFVLHSTSHLQVRWGALLFAVRDALRARCAASHCAMNPAGRRTDADAFRRAEEARHRARERPAAFAAAEVVHLHHALRSVIEFCIMRRDGHFWSRRGGGGAGGAASENRLDGSNATRPYTIRYGSIHTRHRATRAHGYSRQHHSFFSRHQNLARNASVTSLCHRRSIDVAVTTSARSTPPRLS